MMGIIAADRASGTPTLIAPTVTEICKPAAPIDRVVYVRGTGRPAAPRQAQALQVPSLPMPKTLSPMVARLVGDLESGRLTDVDALVRRASALSDSDVQAFAGYATHKGWINVIDKTRMLWTTALVRDECFKAGGNPDDPRTTRRLVTPFMNRSSMRTVARHIIEKAGKLG